MSLLDEADLWAGHKPAQRRPKHPMVGMSVQFRCDSVFARNLRVPTGRPGRVTGACDEDGETLFGVWIDGVGQCSGVRGEDLERVGQER